MRTLVISDHLEQLHLVDKDLVTFMKWTQDTPLSLAECNSVVIDTVFKGRTIKHKNLPKLLNDLKNKLKKRDYLSRNKLILVVICGSTNIAFKLDIPIGASEDEEAYMEETISTYGFLEHILPGYGRMDFEEGRHMHSIAPLPLGRYLAEYKQEPTFLYYDYDPDSEECRDITPLAKMKEDGNASVAFECRIGKGLLIVLPPYNIRDRENALLFLLKICGSYFNQRTGIKEIGIVHELIPDEKARDDFIEALSCLHYHLYTASVAMCRRSLETSVFKEAPGNPKGFLKERINELFNKHRIDSNLRDIAHKIREFGNLAAHGEKLPESQITEKDARAAVEFVKVYFKYFYLLPRDIRDAEQRRLDMEGKEAH